MSHQQKTKKYPKCGGVATQTSNPKHLLPGGGHMAVHSFMNGHPLLGLIAAGATLIGLTGVVDQYRCSRRNEDC